MSDRRTQVQGGLWAVVALLAALVLAWWWVRPTGFPLRESAAMRSSGQPVLP